jgi:protein gp37
MMKKGIGLLVAAGVVFIASAGFSSCKSCNKGGDTKEVHADSASIPVVPHVQNAINLPHADSSLAPVFAKIMDDVFDASRKKDYVKLASYLVYRGPDMKRFGYSVFNTKNAYERTVVKITAEVFNKWNSDCETKDYARIFTLQQPDGRNMDVLEVIFVSRKGVDRKFFGFLPLTKDDYKIVDVTSNLQ